VNFPPDEEPGVRSRLSRALRDALRGRDQPAISALRSALAAIANAEAVDAGQRLPAAAGSAHFAGAAAGPGAAEAARKELTETAMQDIVRAEIADRQTANGQYRQGGHAERADRLRAEITVLEAVLAPGD
jgi:uncharacterized protein YqeY